ncbi:hypothetical protein V5738_11675 [Salinisphaera sp. SPP-AMP-43]|uniref:hypothetical protein n=1 Tax=Salinisphaera sp. SPP-AMP-43 TaxID=3121288 RepID=UPI003C6DD882
MAGHAATEASPDRINQLQQQIDALQNQLHELQTRQDTAPQATEPAPTPTPPEQQQSVPNVLTFNGGVETGYQIEDSDIPNRRTGGDLYLQDVILGASGQHGNISYDTSYWFLGGDEGFLQTGEVSYQFGSDSPHSLTGGFFQVPFGNLPYGYESFYGNLAYEIGFTDNQGAGLGYTYQSGPWRIDVDAFKNNNLSQQATYGATPAGGYSQINGGNARLAYTFDQGGSSQTTVSLAGQGGQIEVGGGGGDNGSRWAATAAVNADIGAWNFQGQYVDYRYDIPAGQTQDGAALPTDAVTFENYGGLYQVPASAQIYRASAARNFEVDWGPVTAWKLYDDYGYLDVGGRGRYTSTVPGEGDTATTGDGQFNIAGLAMEADPVYIWAEVLSSKDAAMSGVGPSDGDWHHSFMLSAAFYFSGQAIGAGS